MEPAASAPIDVVACLRADIAVIAAPNSRFYFARIRSEFNPNAIT